MKGSCRSVNTEGYEDSRRIRGIKWARVRVLPVDSLNPRILDPIFIMKVDKDFYRELLDNLFDGVYLVDCDRRITYWNKSAEKITGFKASEVLGKCCCDDVLIHVNINGVKLIRDSCPLLESLKEGRIYEGEAYLPHKDGHRVPVLIRTRPIYDPEGKIIGAVEVFSDNSPRITDRHRIKEIQKMALFDPLTELGNRRYIEMNIESRLNEMDRYGWLFGILMIDIDQLKSINETHGYDVGDKILRMVAQTLLKNTRPFDLIGRWGGEEFVAIIVNVDDNQLYSIANKLFVLLGESNLSAGSIEINLSVSIGATLARPSDNVDSLLVRANQLVCQCKASGGNRVSVNFDL